jgi:hypothetical protein
MIDQLVAFLKPRECQRSDRIANSRHDVYRSSLPAVFGTTARKLVLFTLGRLELGEIMKRLGQSAILPFTDYSSGKETGPMVTVMVAAALG